MKVIPMPVTVALGQLIMINIALPLYQGRGVSPAFRFWGGKLRQTAPRSYSHPHPQPDQSRITGRDITSWVLPLAALKLLASLSSQLSLLKVPVSYTHTVKVCTAHHMLRVVGVGCFRAVSLPIPHPSPVHSRVSCRYSQCHCRVSSSTRSTPALPTARSFPLCQVGLLQSLFNGCQPSARQLLHTLSNNRVAE